MQDKVRNHLMKACIKDIFNISPQRNSATSTLVTQVEVSSNQWNCDLSKKTSNGLKSCSSFTQVWNHLHAFVRESRTFSSIRQLSWGLEPLDEAFFLIPSSVRFDCSIGSFLFFVSFDFKDLSCEQTSSDCATFSFPSTPFLFTFSFLFEAF